MKEKLGQCKNHGKTLFVLRGNRFRCRKCAVEAVTRRRQKVKQMAVTYKGGKCCRCGYDKSVWAMDFHHLDPNQKDFSLSDKGHCRSWESVKLELDKCILVCRNCHAEIHEEQSVR